MSAYFWIANTNFDLGFKALAYPAANPSADSPVLPCPCSFVFWCDTSKLATLLVFVTIPTTHHAETQFVLQYDADKLDTSGVSLANSNELCKQPQLEEIRCKSKKRSEIKSLCLATMDPPPLWCATGTRSFSSRPGDEPAFQQFVNLAKASNIRVVLDLLHMRQKDRGMFRAFGKAATHLQRYPVEDSLEKQDLERASWKIFTPSEAAGAAGVLPAYEGYRTRKRSRQGRLLNKTSTSSSTDLRRKPQLAHPTTAALHSSVFCRLLLGSRALIPVTLIRQDRPIHSGGRS